MSLTTGVYWNAIEQQLDSWVPACGGTEEPFQYGNRRFLYVFNPASEKHGYLDLGSDIVYDDYRFQIIGHSTGG